MVAYVAHVPDESGASAAQALLEAATFFAERGGIQHNGDNRSIIRRMYVPVYFKPDDENVRELLRNPRAADLITTTAEGMLATMLPLVYDEPGSRAELGEWGALLGHVARNNRQWEVPSQGHALVIVRGPDA
jgi:hypothetical protein